MRNYSKQIDQYWPTIMEAWRVHSAKQPIIECDLAKQKVYAHDSAQYINGLSDRTRESTRREFDLAMAEGDILLFVKDSKNRVLQSYRISGGSTPEKGMPNQLPNIGVAN